MGNNTDLKGAVIASEADDTRKNRLDTGTISFSDIENKADFNVTHVSVSGGTGGPGMPTAYQNSDSASSTTKSAVEQGQLIIRNQDKQQQNIADLSRDTESANNPLKQIFDKQKELDKIETVELIKDIAQQAKSITQKYDRIQAQKDLDNNKDKLDKLDAAAKEEAIKEQARAEQDPNYQPKSYDEIYAQYYHDEVDNIVINNAQKNLGTMGSDVSKGIDTATAIITGIITGDITGGLAGASAPWLAEQIKLHTGHMGEDGKWETDDIASNLIAHAILGAVVAELQGNSALSGGAGAVAGEVAADIIRKQLYGKEVKDLTEEEKQTISALSQLAAGLAVAAGGGSVGDAGAAINSSKNAVENNNFGLAIVKAAEATCNGDTACEQQVIKEGIDSYNEMIIEGGTPQVIVLGTLIVAPAAIAAAEAGMAACSVNPVLCANQVAIWVMETIGAEAMPAAGLGMTASQLANSLSKAQLKELSALMALENSGELRVTSEIIKDVKKLLNDTPETKRIYKQIENTVVANLEPGNKASTSIIRNGERLVLNQGNLPTCGANSCAMVLDTAGIEYDLNKLIIDSKVGSDGARMTDLVSALNKQGLNDARFISKASIETLSSVTSNGNPAIVAMKLDRGYHAVVVDGITVRNGQPVVAIRDPAGGRQYFTPIAEFKSKFTGQAIFTNSK